MRADDDGSRVQTDLDDLARDRVAAAGVEPEQIRLKTSIRRPASPDALRDRTERCARTVSGQRAMVAAARIRFALPTETREKRT